jgi:hypothetical protein
MTNGQILRPDMFNEILRNADINAIISERRCRITLPMHLMEEPKSRWKGYDITPALGYFNAFFFCYNEYKLHCTNGFPKNTASKFGK